MKVGTKSIPDFRFNANLISDIRTPYEKFGNSQTELATIAEVLDHKSPKSGIFLMKIAAMKCYGLIDGRVKITVTKIGQKIAESNKETSDKYAYNKFLVDAVERIPL